MRKATATNRLGPPFNPSAGSFPKFKASVDSKTIATQETPSQRPRFIMLGGFLGAGKTTTILRLAQHLQRLGQRPGLITNDQAEGLVDTAVLEELELPVREIVGGCFCCKSEALVDALEKLASGIDTKPGARRRRNTQTFKPDVFIAEPVGSCTDLVATVTLPLEQIYRTGFIMAPYAVLVDPFRAEQVLGIGNSQSGLQNPKLAGSKAAELRAFSQPRRERKSLAAQEARKRPITLKGVEVSRGNEPATPISASEAEEIVAIQQEMKSVIARIAGRQPTEEPRLARNLAPHITSGFSDDVNYIYRKQLEEAEIIVINKLDLTTDERLARLRESLRAEFPDVRIVEIASREGKNLDPLFHALLNETGRTPKVMQVDYKRYGAGEALLGWVNGRYQIRSVRIKQAGRAKASREPAGPMTLAPDTWLMGLAKEIQALLRKKDVEIAHLKLCFGGEGGLAVVQLARSDTEPEFTQRIARSVSGGELRVNLRAEADPDRLLAAVNRALVTAVQAVPGLSITTASSQHFRPGQPKPTHRVGRVA